MGRPKEARYVFSQHAERSIEAFFIIRYRLPVCNILQFGGNFGNVPPQAIAPLLLSVDYRCMKYATQSEPLEVNLTLAILVEFVIA